MKNLICLLICAAYTTLSFAYVQDALTKNQLLVQANNAYYDKDYAKSSDLYDQLINRFEPDLYTIYDAACSAALANRLDHALQLLDRCVEAGYINLDHLQKDPDLKSLHDRPEWLELIDTIKQNLETYEAQFNPELRATLRRIKASDQDKRRQTGAIAKKYGRESKEYKALWAEIHKLDAQNLIEIEAIIAEMGYPGNTLAGNLSNVAFLVIQHAPLATQEKYQPMILAAADKGELSKFSAALLIDRIRVRKGLKQIYGTQYTVKPEGVSVDPIQDEHNVNQRRAEMGMPPIEQNYKSLGIPYTPPKATEQ